MSTILHRYRREVAVFGVGVLYMAVCAAGQHSTGNAAMLGTLDNARWTIDCLLATLLAFLGLREADKQDRAARRWFFLGWIIYSVGMILWDIQVMVGWNPFPGPSDLFYLSLAPCLTIGLLTVLLKGQTKSETRAVLLDLTGIVVMALTLTLALYVPLWGNTAVMVNVAAVLYPVFFITTLGVCILTVLTRKINPGFGTVVTLLSLAGLAYC